MCWKALGPVPALFSVNFQSGHLSGRTLFLRDMQSKVLYGKSTRKINIFFHCLSGLILSHRNNRADGTMGRDRMEVPTGQKSGVKAWSPSSARWWRRGRWGIKLCSRRRRPLMRQINGYWGRLQRHSVVWTYPWWCWLTRYARLPALPRVIHRLALWARVGLRPA